ncbi:MAG: AcrR family transcriptional regulator [Saprospiraceae bacterium]|jgi:AcrR family transcriptional regulator
MESKAKILQGATGLFLKYGVKSVTMDDISRELGISKKTLYQHVENKADLIEQTVQLYIDDEKKMIASIRGEAENAIHEMVILAKYITQMFREMPSGLTYDLQKYHRKSWDLMESYNQTHIYGVIKDNIERGIEQGVYRNDLNPDIIAKLYVGKTSIIVDEDVFPLRDYNKENLFKEYIKYHLHGIASAKGLKLLEKHSLI